MQIIVWCVVSPEGRPMLETIASERTESIRRSCRADIHGHRQAMEWWQDDKRNGYCCIKLRLTDMDHNKKPKKLVCSKCNAAMPSDKVQIKKPRSVQFKCGTTFGEAMDSIFFKTKKKP